MARRLSVTQLNFYSQYQKRMRQKRAMYKKFSPATLFAANENGYWHDLTDIKTLFVDAAGTTPAVVGQPVGLLLDKRLGLVPGVELWVDPPVMAGEASRVSANVYRIYSSAGVNSYVTNAVPEAGVTYEVTFNVDSVITGAVAIEVAGTPTFNTTGFKRAIVVPATSSIAFKRSTGATDVQISNISIKRLPGNHAIQNTTAAKPILRQHYEEVEAELVTNGTFATNTNGWGATNANLTVSNGRLIITAIANGAARATQMINGLVPGKQYQVSLTSRKPSNAGPGSAGSFMANGNSTYFFSSTDNRRSYLITATATSHNLTIELNTSSLAGDVAEFDDISIKEARAWRTVGAEKVTNNGPFVMASGSGGGDFAADLNSLATYRVTYTATAAGIANIILYANGYFALHSVLNGTNTVTLPITSVGGSLTDAIRISGTGAGTLTLHSIKEVSDNVGYYLEFDGVDDWLRSTFTIAQPWDRISALQQISWTVNDQIFGGATANAGSFYQDAISPKVSLYDGSANPSATNLAVGVNGVVIERHDGVNSRLGINNGAYVTGNSGANLPGGITIGANQVGTSAANFRYYGGIEINRALTNDETAQTKTHFGKAIGLTL